MKNKSQNNPFTNLIKVKAKAIDKNIPYQTLLGSLIHHHAEDKKDFSL